MTDDTGAPAPDEAEKEWWDDPSMPWRHKPTRADVACLTALGVAGVYGLIMLPLRPVVLGLAPHLLGSLGWVGRREMATLASSGELPPLVEATLALPGARLGFVELQRSDDEIYLGLSWR